MLYFILICVLILVIVVGLIAMIASSSAYDQRKCSKNPKSLCPSKLYIDHNGCLRRTDIHKCCKYIDQIKAMNKFACMAEPNKSYNGLIVTPEFKKQALKRQSYIQSLNSDGPSD